jgi:hypothetical protein
VTAFVSSTGLCRPLASCRTSLALRSDHKQVAAAARSRMRSTARLPSPSAAPARAKLTAVPSAATALRTRMSPWTWLNQAARSHGDIRPIPAATVFSRPPHSTALPPLRNAVQPSVAARTGWHRPPCAPARCEARGFRSASHEVLSRFSAMSEDRSGSTACLALVRRVGLAVTSSAPAQGSLSVVEARRDWMNGR